MHKVAKIFIQANFYTPTVPGNEFMKCRFYRVLGTFNKYLEISQSLRC
ncbi:hypothetical protein FDUTEX481_00876 [Tolypothrix sp. PCC 7601]|nr:hypothetical protein FDUTEX481_00876 [Tolypothrix sp. PCC 7601]